MEHGISEHALQIIGRHVDMASQFCGSGASAPEIMQKMQKMQEVMRATDREAGKILSSELRRTVEKAGGIEGITRKEAMIAGAGGEKELTKLLDRVQSLGGMRVIEAEITGKQELADRAGGQSKLDYAVRFAERFKDIHEMERYIKSSEEALAFIRKAGSMEQAEEMLATRKYLKEHGGLETFKLLLKTAGKYGGVEAMTKLLAAGRKAWAKVFEAENEEKSE